MSFCQQFSGCPTYNRAVYNLREMPYDVAHRFLTDLEHVHTSRVAFETKGSAETWQLFHILNEHEMEIPGMDEGMTMFVADTPVSLSKFVGMLQMSMSESGFIQSVPVVDSLSRRFDNRPLRKRFYSGIAKVVSWDRFLDRFFCGCPSYEEIRWYGYGDFLGDNKPNAHITLFMYDVVSTFSDYMPARRPTLLYLMGLLEPKALQELHIEIELPPPPGSCRCNSEYQCDRHYRSIEKLRMIVGSSLPPLQRDNKSVRKFSFDTRKLYCLDFASSISSTS